MKKKLIHSWAQTEDIRNSVPNIICNNFYYLYDDGSNGKDSKNQSITQRINKVLLKYKEFRFIYRKTSIPPAYFLYALLTCLLLIMIGFFDNLLTSLIATIYPLYNSIKALQCKYIGEHNPDGQTYYTSEDNDEDIKAWLTYWIVYALFINFECIFGCVLKHIPLYFFIKVVFLLVLFLPNYQLAKWLYCNIIKWWFIKYERDIVEISDKIMRTLALNKKSDNDTDNYSITHKEFLNPNGKWKRMNENIRYESVESDTVYDNPFTPLEKASFYYINNENTGNNNSNIVN